MTPILDPRRGDIEDDASSTAQRSMLALAGSLLAEISLPKLVVTWVLLIGLPGLLLGVAPLVLSAWLATMTTQAKAAATYVWPVLLVVPLAGVFWLGVRPALRLAESSFWSLNALAVQPCYILLREGLRHVVESRQLGSADPARRAAVRAVIAAAAGVIVCALALLLIAAVWPATRWQGRAADLATPFQLVPVVLANTIVLLSAYLAVAALTWGIADATMDQPRDFEHFPPCPAGARTWRVAHLSDLHTVGERHGFRIESGRAGPSGNGRLVRVLARLEEIHAAAPLDVILMSGDMTDAGRSAEWAELFAALDAHPALAPLVVALPGNHDVNVVDRASPARMELPTSPMKRLRKMRTLSALEKLQGGRLHVVDSAARMLGATLSDTLTPHEAAMAAFADRGTWRLSRALAGVWEQVFPMVLPPADEDGLGIIVLNSNAETHFSFTNALGLVSAEQARAFAVATRQYPRACWIVALHHHVTEYPQRAKALSERIGTALINGSWFVRQLRHLADHVVVMHGHRHVDWIGECGDVLIVSAPSPVMDATDDEETSFYIHTMAIGADGRLRLLEPERIAVPGEHAA